MVPALRYAKNGSLCPGGVSRDQRPGHPPRSILGSRCPTKISKCKGCPGTLCMVCRGTRQKEGLSGAPVPRPPARVPVLKKKNPVLAASLRRGRGWLTDCFLFASGE